MMKEEDPVLQRPGLQLPMTLSQFSYYVRKIGPFVVIGIFLFVIFYLLISNLISTIANRPRQVPFTPEFGILPKPQFAHPIPYPANFTIMMENIEGRPVTATDSAFVFYTPTTRTRFGYQQTLAYMARAVGFDTEVQQYELNGLTATYKDDIRTLTVDITNFNFTFQSDFRKISDVFTNTYIPSETVIQEEAQTFMRQMNKYDGLLSEATSHIIYLKFDPATQEFLVVKSPAEANVVEVDYFNPDIQGFPAVSSTYYNSQNYVTLVYRDSGPVVIKAQVKNYAHDFTSGAPYPVKTGDEAFADLLNRKGHIVSPAKGSTDIIIRNMFLGYYDSEDYQEFLLPVYVFLGDNGFAAYVDAIPDEYLK